MKLKKGQILVNRFINRYFTEHQKRRTRLELLKDTLDKAVLGGLYLEFGVWKGFSINYIARLRPQQKFYGFDCFKGLPEDWSAFYPKGWMNLDEIPKVEKNAELVVGLFNDTLKPFLESHKEKIAYLHLDADLYSSTKYVLFTLADQNRLQRGTIIEFDEVFYQDSPNTVLDDEYRVFNEFISKYDVIVRWLYFFKKGATTRASLIIEYFGGEREVGIKREDNSVRVVAIIAARDEEKYLPETLDSLLSQTHSLYKIIVINDGSQDRTLEISEEKGCIVINLPYHRESYLGNPRLAMIWNHGFKEAEKYNPDYLLISGADHIYPENYLSRLIEVTKGNTVISGGVIADHGLTEVPRGSGRLIDSKFWKRILGFQYYPCYGFESYPIMKAKSLGFETSVVNDLITFSRKLKRNKIKSWGGGIWMRASGYHWTRVVSRIIILALKRPIAALYMLYGFVTYHGPKLDIYDYVRGYQKKTLFRSRLRRKK